MTGNQTKREGQAGLPVHKAFDKHEYERKITDVVSSIRNERSLKMAYQYVLNLTK